MLECFDPIQQYGAPYTRHDVLALAAKPREVDPCSEL